MISPFRGLPAWLLSALLPLALPANVAAPPSGTPVPGAPNCPMFPANNIWNTDISKLPPFCRDAKAVLTEMQHYGLILADNGSNWFFQGSADPQWPDALVSLLKRIPASAFQAVDESCLMVSRGSGEAAAMPGCPIG